MTPPEGIETGDVSMVLNARQLAGSALQVDFHRRQPSLPALRLDDMSRLARLRQRFLRQTAIERPAQAFHIQGKHARWRLTRSG